MHVFRLIACLGLMVTVADVALSAETEGWVRGKALVDANCAPCHATGLTGDSARKDAPPFREVMRVYPANSLTEALGEGLITGHPDMPEFVFPAEDVASIVEYLHSLEEPQ